MENFVESVNLKFREGKVKLSVEEARNLYLDLKQLFGEMEKVFVPYLAEVDRRPLEPYPTYPIVTGTGPITPVPGIPGAINCECHRLSPSRTVAGVGRVEG